MSLYEFKLFMEFSGYDTFNSERTEKFYKVYLDEFEKQKSK